MRVALSTGDVEAQGTAPVSQLALSSDDRFLYAIEWSPVMSGDDSDFQVAIRRLDTATLAVQAERVLPPGWNPLFLSAS